MSLTPQQLPTLKASILAQTDPAFVALRAANNEQGMADWYNAASGDLFWQTEAPVSGIQDAIDYSAYTLSATIDGTAIQTNRILASQTKQINVQIMLQGRETFNAHPNRARAALLDATTGIPTGAGGALVSAAGTDGVRVMNALTRPASRAERLYSSPSPVQTGTVSAYRVGSFEGSITLQDVSDALRA